MLPVLPVRMPPYGTGLRESPRRAGSRVQLLRAGADMKLPGYCSCSAPARTVYEGVLSCEACGEPIADPLLLRVLGELLTTRRQLAALERKLTEPKFPAPEWLAPKEFAALLGRSVDFVYDHADELGAVRVGDGPRPRLLFPTDPVSSGDFRRDSGETSPAGDAGGEPPISPGR
jgi:hypothetical protein